MSLMKLQKKSALSEPEGLQAFRAAAARALQATHFPTRSDEAWKYFPLEKITALSYENAPALTLGPDPQKKLLENLPADTIRLCFVNGFFAQDLSSLEDLPSGVTICPFSLLDNQQLPLFSRYFSSIESGEINPFILMNHSQFQDGIFIHLSKKTILEKPIHLIFFTESQNRTVWTYPLQLIVLEAEAQASVMESYLGSFSDSPYLTNTYTQIVQHDSSFLHLYKFQNEATQAYHLSTTHASQQGACGLHTHVTSLGAKLSRHEVQTHIQGEGSSCTLQGLYLGNEDQLTDHQTTVDHLKPYGTSTELYKGILSDRAHGVFNGKIIVRSQAQKTFSHQMNKNLMLSDKAEINTKPLLEIFANDVKCNHGATIGRLDPEALFYLRSRGIGESLAQTLLTQGFAQEMISKIREEAFRKYVEESVLQKLDQMSRSS